MRFEFIDAEKAHYPVLVLCAVLLVSRSGYYGWAKRSESARAKADAQLGVQIRAVHHKSREGTAVRAFTQSCVLAAYVSARSGSHG
ncbi:MULTISPECIES: hypothetical protein [Sorangium]|uniref:hypothetical protein n=1 Tax=Sorangium sp. So ce836 TaxID=2969250 RepID=UPI001F3959F8|nr:MULTISPECIES: hypothetical protein [Sorangium]WCQ89918.1 hypothetical protein NQZ70_02616 [Sorangium sp. Soce836]